MWFRALSIGLIILLTAGGFAAAQDDPVAEPVEGDTEMVPAEGDTEMAPAEGDTEMAPAEGDPVDGAEGDEALESEIEEAPAYEDEYQEDLRERYFRITDGFIRPQYLGFGRVGQVPQWPRGIIKAGPFRFSPYLSTGIGYQTNVFLTEEDKKDSWWWEGRLGLTGDASFLKDKLQLRTAMDFTYRDYSRDGVDDDWEGLLGLAVRYNFPFGVWAEVGVTWLHIWDPITGEDLPTRMERDQVDYTFDVGLDEAFQRLVGGRFKLTFGFDVRTRNFQEDEFSLGDRTEWDARLRLSYMLKDDLDVFIQYLYGETYADSIRLADSTRNEITFGIDGAYDITSSGRLQGQVFVGYRKDNFDQQEYSVGSEDFETDPDTSPDRITGGIQLRYLMGTRSSATLLYTREMAFSLEGNYQDVDRVDLSWTYLILRGLTGRVAGYYEINQPSAAGNVYRYSAGAGLRYGINDFIDADLFYDARWRNDTDPIRGVDYTDHRVVLSLTFYLR